MVISLLLWIVTACASEEPPRLTPQTTTPITTLDCELITAQMPLICIGTGNLLIQSDTQQTLRIAGTTLTLDGTLYIENGNSIIIAAIEGTAVVGAGGITRIIQTGTQITLPDFTGDTAPSNSEPYNIERARLAPLQQLPRTIQLPRPLNPTITERPPNLPTVQIHAESTGCTPRPDWTNFYTIQRGDTLTRIATMHETPLTDLQEGNCISNPNELVPGTILRVPINITEGEPPAPARFYVDRASIPPGECAMLHWEVDNAEAVYLNMTPVEMTDSYEVCPLQTSNYTLRVQFSDDVEATYTATLLVVLENE